jgi:hypothetical protein
MISKDIADTKVYRIGGPKTREYITEISVMITNVVNNELCLRYEEYV